jgi:hypothetical protein
MYPVQVSVPALPLINMPDVCTNQPMNSENAFSCHHVEVVKTNGYPLKVWDFVKFCSSTSILQTATRPLPVAISEL